MGNHVVEIEIASVDLDYNEILENIEDTIAARVSDQITDEAWDAVEYQVNEAISEHEQEHDHDSQGASGVEDQVYEGLLELNRIAYEGWNVFQAALGVDQFLNALKGETFKIQKRLNNSKFTVELHSHIDMIILTTQ